MGKIPGQGNNDVLLATPPNGLEPHQSPPLGKCAGWRPDDVPRGGLGYANADIYYLEVCLFDQMCDNREELFANTGRENTPFRCKFNAERFRELERLLSEPADLTVDPNECRHSNRGR